MHHGELVGLQLRCCSWAGSCPSGQCKGLVNLGTWISLLSVWSPGVVSFGFMACLFVVWTEGKVAEYWCLSKAFLSVWRRWDEFSWSLPQGVHSPLASKEKQKLVNDKFCVGSPSSGQSLRSLMMKKSVNILPNCHCALLEGQHPCNYGAMKPR